RLQAAFPGQDVTTLTDTQVAPFADQNLAYDSVGRVATKVIQGQGCSACTGGLGTYSYAFQASPFADGYNIWRRRTTETLPDGNQNIVYTNFAGEVMLAIYKDTTSGQQWLTFYKYDGAGRLILAAQLSAVTGYDEHQPDLLAYNSSTNNYFYLADSTGLIETVSYYTSTTAGETTAG